MKVPWAYGISFWYMQYDARVWIIHVAPSHLLVKKIKLQSSRFVYRGLFQKRLKFYQHLMYFLDYRSLTLQCKVLLQDILCWRCSTREALIDRIQLSQLCINTSIQAVKILRICVCCLKPWFRSKYINAIWIIMHTTNMYIHMAMCTTPHYRLQQNTAILS